MSNERRHSSEDDTPLVNAWRKGDLPSFEVLVRKHQKRLFNIAYRITGDFDGACELVQDAFVAAYRGIDSFRGESRFSTWLTGIVVELIRGRLQAGQPDARYPAGAVTGEERGRIAAASGAGPSSLGKLESRDVVGKIEECLKTLPVDFREAIVLRDLQGLPYHEIGEILNVLEGTVRSRLYRGREMVRDCLKLSMGDL